MGLKGSVGYIWFIEELFIQKMMRVLNITVHFSYFFRGGGERKQAVKEGIYDLLYIVTSSWSSLFISGSKLPSQVLYTKCQAE